MDVKVGTSIQHYRILSAIGKGGMGAVYLAEDTRLERQVALKVLLAEVTGDQSRLRRFVREAKAASGLNHPNILTVYEIGDFENSPYIATELIKGETLRERLQGEPLNLRDVLDIAIQISAALNAAHGAGIVHRDIKPENIMLRDDGLVKVLDFGLAKLAESRKARETGEDESTLLQSKIQNPKSKIQNLTIPGMVVGTVAYMSPEQARGKTVDARSDIWSLGVVVYELLTGHTPFSGETTNDSIAAILRNDPPPLNEDTPAELQRIVRKILRKNADERYQTVKDLLIDLKDLKHELEFFEELERSQIAHAPGSSNVSGGQIIGNAMGGQGGVISRQNIPQQRSNAEYFVSKVKQHKFGAVLILTLAVTIIAGFFGYRYFAPAPSKQIDSIAVMPFVNESGHADIEYLSDGITETLINSLSQLPNFKVMSRGSVYRFKGTETDPKKIAGELGVGTLLTGRVKQIGDQIIISVSLDDAQGGHHIWGEQYARKQSDLLSLQSEIARAVSGQLKSKLSGADIAKVEKNYTADPEAYRLYLMGRQQSNKFTAESIKQAAKFYRRAIEKDPNYGLAYAGLADAYVAHSILSVAPWKDTMPRAKAAVLRALEIDDSLAEAHIVLASYLVYYEWDRVGGEKECRRATELNPNNAGAHDCLAQVLSATKRYDESIDESRRAEELDPLSPLFGGQLGVMLVCARRFDEAISQYKRVIPLDPAYAFNHLNLGWVYGFKEMYPEAIAETRKYLELNDDPTGKGYLGLWLARSGSRAEALKLLDDLKTESARRYVAPYAQALIYIGLGEKDEALDLLEREADERTINANFYGVYPELDPLRSEPRFKALLKRMNLPE